MTRMTLCLLLTISMLGCATQPKSFIDASHKPRQEQQKDVLECQALAAQAAMGSGQWSTDPAIRAGISDATRERYFAQCLESRGWVWSQNHRSPPPPAPRAAHILRLKTCLHEVAHLDPGPIDGQASPQLTEALNAYVTQYAQTAAGSGRTADDPELKRLAYRALLHQCYQEDKLPPHDHLRQHAPPPS